MYYSFTKVLFYPVPCQGLKPLIHFYTKTLYKYFKMKHLFCYIDSFSIVKFQIKRFYPCRTSPPTYVGVQYCNVDQTHDITYAWRSVVFKRSNDVETNNIRIFSARSIILYYSSRLCNSTYAEGNIKIHCLSTPTTKIKIIVKM